METLLIGISIILMIQTSAVVTIAVTTLCMFVIVRKGVNQHIQALQGIYDVMASKKP